MGSRTPSRRGDCTPRPDRRANWGQLPCRSSEKAGDAALRAKEKGHAKSAIEIAPIIEEAASVGTEEDETWKPATTRMKR